MKFVRILMFLSMLPLAMSGFGELVNVLELGVKNDGSADISEIVNAASKTKTEFRALNRLCRKHQVKAVEEFETIRIFVLNESAEPTRMRFMTEYMGDYFRPVDHGTLRTIDGQVRYREVRAE